MIRRLCETHLQLVGGGNYFATASHSDFAAHVRPAVAVACMSLSRRLPVTRGTACRVMGEQRRTVLVASCAVAGSPARLACRILLAIYMGPPSSVTTLREHPVSAVHLFYSFPVIPCGDGIFL